MHATSTEQVAAYERREPAPSELVRPEVWTVGLPMGTPLPPFTSLLHIVRDDEGGIHLIDPGLATDAAWERVTATLAELGATLRDVRSIIATHHHNEHIDLAERLRADSGAQLILSRREQEDIDARPADRAAQLREQLADWQAPETPELVEAMRDRERYLDRPLPQPDLLVHEGDVLPIPGIRLEVMMTPGHTPGSMSLWDRERDIVFTGDHLLPNQVPGFGLGVGLDPTTALSEYLDSLRRLPHGPEALPSHGWRFRGIAARARQIGERHLRRTREVAALLDHDASLGVWQLAAQLSWAAGWKALSGYTLLNALQQTAIHRSYVLSGAPLDYDVDADAPEVAR